MSFSWSGTLIFILAVMIIKITIADPYRSGQRQSQAERTPASIESVIEVETTSSLPVEGPKQETRPERSKEVNP